MRSIGGRSGRSGRSGWWLGLGTAIGLLIAVGGWRAKVAAALPGTPSDEWTATDGLGRKLPTYKDVGPRRSGKFVGMFYFLWLGQHGSAGPYDITKILAKDPKAIDEPNNPLWGGLGVPHHWGESAFGYYVSDDEWVLRKHAQMLSDAGVDTVIFDVTNQLTYPKCYLTLCKVWSQVRKEGGRTPQIAFLTPFGDPARVVQTLYNDFYKPGLYSDLWFRWEGKPLIMADPNLIQPGRMLQSQRVPADLPTGGSLGQTLTVDRPFSAVGGEFPTWSQKNSGMTLLLREGGPGGKLLVRQRFDVVPDNAREMLHLEPSLPAGRYYLEMREPKGQIGWWSQTGDVYAGGRAFADGIPAPGDRALFIQYVGAANPVALSSNELRLSEQAAVDLSQQIRGFFTFRKPQPDYFVGPTGPAQWGWLEVTPQHAFYKVPGVPEQVTVGVAQNATDGKLSVLSNPRSHGRSFHEGAEPGPAGQDFTGRNFAEQWKRALEIDPAFIFVTGWNEWIAGRFGRDSPFYGSGPVAFVDEFDHEFSRDIEPVSGGHTDAYYYQLVANIRRFKGMLPPPPASRPRTLPPNGNFRKWRDIQPEYRDDAFDTRPRNHPGWGSAGVYRNTTGRNDFVVLKVAHDARNVYFYARTRQPIGSYREPGWMQLFIAARAGAGWEGFNFRVNGRPVDARTTSLEKSAGGWKWKSVSRIGYRVKGSEMELSVPRAAIGLQDGHRAIQLDFKWMDNVGAEKDILNLYRNGDTAPNGRFRYHYEGIE